MIPARLGRLIAAACFLPLFAAAGSEFPPEGEEQGERPVILETFETRGTGVARAAADWPGISGDLLDTPRSVTRVSAAQLRDHGVLRIEDLARFVAGATEATLYGIAGVPVIRGDLGDVAQNGQRRAFNRNAFPVSFNAVESIDVVAGAGPVASGYATGTGGAANLVTKRASFDGPAGAVTVATGSWGEFRAGVDATGPLSGTVAWRVSIERERAGGFHRLAGHDSWNGYMAFAWVPNEQVRWDLSFEAYDVDFVENPGINRPTQALIDRGEYITGSSVQNGGAGSFFGNTFTPTGTVRLDGSQTLISPFDEGRARTFTAQLTGVFTGDPGRRITSRTLFESVTSEKFSAYTFYSYVPRSLTLEQRIEVEQEVEAGGLRHELHWGAALRGEERVSFVDFFNEAMNAFDVTLDPATFVFPTDQLFGVRPVPGRPGRFAVPGANYGVFPTTSLSQTLHSRLLNAGVFINDSVALARRVQLVLGGRLDAVAVDSMDPLPPEGFTPVSDSLVEYLPAGSAGLNWRVRDGVSAYFTWQRAAAVESSSGTGGFGLTANRLPKELFKNRSELFETGVKFRTADGKLSGGGSIHRQRRHRTNPRLGRPDEILVRGVEAAVEWRALDGLTLSANGTWRDAHFLDGPLPGSIATVPAFDPARPSGVFGAFTAGDRRLPGLPRWESNVSAAWQARGGLGINVWGNLEGSQNLDLFGNVVIPAQQTWNTGVSYRRGGFEVRVDVLNFAGAFNWRPTSTPFAGGDLVLREPPRSWRVTVRQSF